MVDPIILVQQILTDVGFSDWMSRATAYAVVLSGSIIVSAIAHFIATRVLLVGVHSLIQKTKFHWDDYLIKHKALRKLGHIAPALVIYFCAELIFPAEGVAVGILQRIAVAYMTFMLIFAVSAVINVCGDVYDDFEVSRERPIRTYLQVVKIVAWLVGIVLVIATIMGKSPIVFLSGLGAMTAILMLVFRDSILGFVASVQFAGNDMVRAGDWIEVPKYGADGDVIEINLTTVKVQNWDKTISTIPTYALVQDSFKNWRGMSESQGRRIKRHVSIDINSVRFCDDELLQRFEEIDLIAEYVKQRRVEIDAYNKEKLIDAAHPINGRRMTNIGTFRRYVEEYLLHHDQIHQGMTLLVRQLAPTERGVPIEIYCFSKDKTWAGYEGIQGDIFDHLFAILPEFGLRAFQNPTGHDMQQFARA